MENEKLCLKDYFFSLHFAVNHTNLLLKKKKWKRSRCIQAEIAT